MAYFGDSTPGPALRENYGTPGLDYHIADYPSCPELRCGTCHGPGGPGGWVNNPPGGCQYRGRVLAGPKKLACKNGKPYDCKCNLISAPYSMPFEAHWPGCTNPRSGCPGPAGPYKCPAPGTYYVRPPFFLRDT
jgi:hypothetical protein